MRHIESLIRKGIYRGVIKFVNDEHGYLMCTIDGASFYCRQKESEPVKMSAELFNNNYIQMDTIVYDVLMGFAHMLSKPELNSLFSYCNSYLNYILDDDKGSDVT